MKYIKSIWLALVAVLTLTTCGGSSSEPNPEPVHPYITISPKELQFEGNGGIKPVTVDANVNWSVNANQDWCQVNVVNEKTIEVTVGDNPLTTQRSAIITLKGNNQSATVTVTQAANDYSIENPHDNVSDQPAYSRKQ